ncbi:hypothetical protein DFQ27_007455 [Actinomortierella ambigua]|uniref:FAD-binding domain-containing protein n=1 Tax=Actinomortierella ambigua TaxID=1343610 RepID=A0A9P6U020_9FUNG|nr:hypothetical protein DFQ27_007455 [Actinomortierella ambigua]
MAGLTLAIMLEKAGIRYVLVDKTPSAQPLGGGLFLSPQVMRVFDQLGILPELDEIGTRGPQLKYFTQDGKEVACVVPGHLENFGYHAYFFARVDLVEVLLRHIPKDKVLWGKKVLSTMQNENGVMVRFSDNSSLDGDILIGADGAYSAVRQSLYRNLKKKGVSVPASDTGMLHFQEFCILGVTDYIGDKYPIVNSTDQYLSIVLGSKDKPYNLAYAPTKGGRLCWRIAGKLIENQIVDEASFRFSDWASESIQDIVTEIERVPIAIGGTVGNLLENTPSVSRVMLEACHKTLPAAGQGAIQAILDAVVLANLMYELPSTSVKDLGCMFATYFEIRGDVTRKVVETSKKLGKMASGKSTLDLWFRNVIIKLVSSTFVQNRLSKKMAGRPVLNYLPEPPLRGNMPDTFPTMTLTQKDKNEKSEATDSKSKSSENNAVAA